MKMALKLEAGKTNAVQGRIQGINIRNMSRTRFIRFIAGGKYGYRIG
jgi:hypothetical protein